MSSLPDISCMNLIKSLYFMMGAFPTTNASGEIVPVFYTDLKKNIIDNKAIDWSSRITSGYGALPDKTVYSVSGFGQYNYYMMKTDSLDKKEGEDDTDVYESGIGYIHVANELLEKTKTIIQTPFNPPYIKNKKTPEWPTGNTFKFWYLEEGEVKVKEAKPCLGLIKPFPQKNDDDTDSGTVWMGMDVWNKFPNISSDPSYAYLWQIMADPIVITEKLNLTEIDLCNLDYSVPVYLDKYGAYFAIVSITRDSKGVCKCELLKLPHE